jgi:ABC-type multidrug transport system ATPase subunit
MSGIEATGLVKRFGSLTAIDGISFKADAGEIFGLLGPNVQERLLPLDSFPA